uniref:Reverse transcriptase domain-containing protein n=1 Tax=Tanacetum cinerariifolium TaxID=118510 RepID=A0A699HJW6_TANCI|nr:reverse transcriptase domain-containing protein [Tanacetum cinerariifolium]
MMPPPGFSTSPQIQNNTTSERSPMITTVFAATTPENTPFAYRASISTNPNPMINLRTELEYFSRDYDEEREMEPIPDPNQEATTTRQPRSLVVRRQRERVVGFEGTPNREGSRIGRNAEGIRPSEIEAEKRGVNLPSLLAAHLGKNKSGQPLRSSLTFVQGGSVTPFVRWIEDYLSDGLKMPSHIGSYNEKGDPDNFLHLFEGAIFMQKWLMPVSCHMFTYTLKDSARIWWNGQKPSSILNYEDLKAKFRSHFSQQKNLTKTHLVVHNINQREGKILKDQGHPLGTITEDRKAGIGGSNSSAPVVIKAKVFGREVKWVHMDSGSSCEVIYEHFFMQLKLSIRASKDVNAEDVNRSFHHSRGHQIPHHQRDWYGIFDNESDKGMKKSNIPKISKQGLPDQIGRNLEAYVDDMVIKSTFKEEMLADIKETFEKFRSINMKLNPKKCSFGVKEGPFLGHLITMQGIRVNPSKGDERPHPFFKVLKSCTDKKNIQWTQEEKASLQEMKKFGEILPTLTAPIQGKILMMYLAASIESRNAALFAKREEEHVPIYFVSRVLQGAELNYSRIEKLILALVHEARKL